MNNTENMADTINCSQPPMTTQQILKVFKPLLENLNKEENLRIGGGAALRLHGLNFRVTNDVDVIIYNPSARQLEVIKGLEVFDEVVNYQTEKDDRHAWKFTKEGATIDLIIEKGRHEDKFELLQYHVSALNGYLPVQSVERIVRAKASYIIHDNQDHSELRCRKKDAVDFINLKNDNFNFKPLE